jgi:hypothetical protein
VEPVADPSKPKPKISELYPFVQCCWGMRPEDKEAWLRTIAPNVQPTDPPSGRNFMQVDRAGWLRRTALKGCTDEEL